MMSLTGTRAALLQIALQDLRGGKALLVDRLLPLADAATDVVLREVIERDRANARRHLARLDTLADLDHSSANHWMASILDHALQDVQEHQPGAVLDTALIGALRKARAAEIVALETALSLAVSEAPAMLAPLGANHAEDRAVEARLTKLFATVCGAVPVA